MKKKFKKHMMCKSGKCIMANTMKDHLSLKKRGFNHTMPKKKK